MNQYNNQNYVSLFNKVTNQIEANPNSVIVSDNDGNITSSRNINQYIDNYSINPNKIDWSASVNSNVNISGNLTVSNRINSTIANLTPINNTEYVTAYYVSSIVSNSSAGSHPINVNIQIGGGTVANVECYYVRVMNVYTYHLVFDLNNINTVGNVFELKLDNFLALLPALNQKYNHHVSFSYPSSIDFITATDAFNTLNDYEMFIKCIFSNTILNATGKMSITLTMFV